MKRHPDLQQLSSEHHRALVIAQRLINACATAGVDAGPDAELLQQAARFVADDMEPHFRWEEEALLPALAAVGEQELVAKTLAEHAELRSLAGRLEEPAASRRFGDLLKEHVRFEERTLFETAQDKLGADALGMIGSYRR
jgi:hemerythrin-like domain-containing protein